MLACRPHGGQQIAPFAEPALAAVNRLLDEVSEHLGIRFAREMMTEPFKPLAQFGEVLDDAVVHHGDAPVARHVRMRVRLARAPVRCPAGMPDAARAREIEVPGRVGESIDLALAMEHLQLAVLLDGDAGGIVPAVLEALQAVDENVLNRTRSGIANDAAHGRVPFPSPNGRLNAAPKPPAL